MMVKNKEVEIIKGNSTVYFASGDAGDHEIGDYNFWTAVGADEFGDWTVIARALSDLPATDRFQRMDQERLMAEDGEDRAAYQMCWDRFDTIELIRPATMREIVIWMMSHEIDAKYAGCFAYFNEVRFVIPRVNI